MSSDGTTNAKAVPYTWDIAPQIPVIPGLNLSLLFVGVVICT